MARWLGWSALGLAATLAAALPIGSLLPRSPRPAVAQQAALVLDTPDPQSGARFGSSIAILPDATMGGATSIVVGAPEATVGGNRDQGRTYVYDALGRLARVLDTANPQPGAGFGSSVGGTWTPSGPVIVVGAPRENVGGDRDQGRAYVYDSLGRLVDVIGPPALQPGTRFGAAVTVTVAQSRVTVAVGAPRENAGGNRDQGRVYIYDALDRRVTAVIDAPDPQPGAGFGTALAWADVDGDGIPELVVGAPGVNAGGNRDQGRAYVFRLSGAHVLTLDSPAAQPGARFGDAVGAGDPDMDGRTEMVVSAPGLDCVAGGRTVSACGAVFTFTAVGVHAHTVSSGAPQAHALLGQGDFCRCPFVFAAAPGEHVGGNRNQGRGYVYDALTGALLRVLDAPDPQPCARLGTALAMGDVNGDGFPDVALGAPAADVGGKRAQGRVYVYTSGSP